MHKKKLFISFLFSLFFYITVLAENFPAALFPLDHYDQNVDRWLPPENSNYNKPILSETYQQERLAEFHRRVFSTAADAASPWSEKFVAEVLSKNPGVLASVKDVLAEYSNRDKSERYIGYGENFRPHTSEWMEELVQNIDLKKLAPPIKYNASNRAIVIRNTQARMLPVQDPHFYSYEIPGQGYPFDNLQASALWVGTPLYIIGKTQDGAWSLIMSSSFVAWVLSDDIANAPPSFVQRWSKAAKSSLLAITYTRTPIIDQHNKKYRLTTYVGTVLPLLKEGPEYFFAWVPLRDVHGNAYVHDILVDRKQAEKIPLAATPANFSRLIKTLQNRPYGWGNSYFYNDCSAETKNLYAPFGIWLPRNSSQQKIAGKTVNLDEARSDARLDYLMKNGHPFTTMVYIGGHIFIYLGNFPNPNRADHALMAMSYQNIWGLVPKDKNRRAIIGQSVLLPILPAYPEDAALTPLTNTKRFQVIYLDAWSDVQRKDSALFF